MALRKEMLAVVNGVSEDLISDDMLSVCEEYFRSGSQTTVLAYDGKTAFGCATICYINVMPTFSHPTGKRAHIMNVYTRADHRRQGAAKKMMTALLDEARQRGVTYVSLDATESGRPLYLSLGFGENKEGMGINL